MNKEQLIKVIAKDEFFLDIPPQISTTGSSPERGFYTRVLLSNQKALWMTPQAREIMDSRWVKSLNDLYDKL